MFVHIEFCTKDLTKLALKLHYKKCQEITWKTEGVEEKKKLSCLGTTDERADQEKVKYLEIPILYLSVTTCSITVAQERKTMFMIELYIQSVCQWREFRDDKQNDGMTQSCLIYIYNVPGTVYMLWQ